MAHQQLEILKTQPPIHQRSALLNIIKHHTLKPNFSLHYTLTMTSLTKLSKKKHKELENLKLCSWLCDRHTSFRSCYCKCWTILVPAPWCYVNAFLQSSLSSRLFQVAYANSFSHIQYVSVHSFLVHNFHISKKKKFKIKVNLNIIQKFIKIIMEWHLNALSSLFFHQITKPCRNRYVVNAC